jgi:hypothetical protein
VTVAASGCGCQGSGWARTVAPARKEEKMPHDKPARPHDFAVGDGASYRIGSDSYACTVTHVSPSGKTVTMRRDKAELAPGWKPEWIGAGEHCANNYDQRWVLTPDPDGAIQVARLTTKGWRASGLPVRKGRHHFHDYNFGTF